MPFRPCTVTGGALPPYPRASHGTHGGTDRVFSPDPTVPRGPARAVASRLAKAWWNSSSCGQFARTPGGPPPMRVRCEYCSLPAPCGAWWRQHRPSSCSQGRECRSAPPRRSRAERDEVGLWAIVRPPSRRFSPAHPPSSAPFHGSGRAGKARPRSPDCVIMPWTWTLEGRLVGPPSTHRLRLPAPSYWRPPGREAVADPRGRSPLRIPPVVSRRPPPLRGRRRSPAGHAREADLVGPGFVVGV